MPPAGFEPAMPTSDQSHTDALVRANTGIRSIIIKSLKQTVYRTHHLHLNSGTLHFDHRPCIYFLRFPELTSTPITDGSLEWLRAVFCLKYEMNCHNLQENHISRPKLSSGG